MALQQEAKPPLFLSIILYVTINFKVGGVNSHGRGTFYNSIYPVPSLLTLISAYCWINVSKSTVKKKVLLWDLDFSVFSSISVIVLTLLCWKWDPTPMPDGDPGEGTGEEFGEEWRFPVIKILMSLSMSSGNGRSNISSEKNEKKSILICCTRFCLDIFEM